MPRNLFAYSQFTSVGLWTCRAVPYTSNPVEIEEISLPKKLGNPGNPKFLVLCFVFEIEFEFRALRRTLSSRELIREECSEGHATKSEPSKEVTLFTLQFA